MNKKKNSSSEAIFPKVVLSFLFSCELVTVVPKLTPSQFDLVRRQPVVQLNLFGTRKAELEEVDDVIANCGCCAEVFWLFTLCSSCPVVELCGFAVVFCGCAVWLIYG